MSHLCLHLKKIDASRRAAVLVSIKMNCMHTFISIYRYYVLFIQDSRLNVFGLVSHLVGVGGAVTAAAVEAASITRHALYPARTQYQVCVMYAALAVEVYTLTLWSDKEGVTCGAVDNSCSVELTVLFKRKHYVHVSIYDRSMHACIFVHAVILHWSYTRRTQGPPCIPFRLRDQGMCCFEETRLLLREWKEGSELRERRARKERAQRKERKERKEKKARKLRMMKKEREGRQESQESPAGLKRMNQKINLTDQLDGDEGEKTKEGRE